MLIGTDFVNGGRRLEKETKRDKGEEEDEMKVAEEEKLEKRS